MTSGCCVCGAPVIRAPGRRGPIASTCSDACRKAMARARPRPVFRRSCVECGEPFETHTRPTVCCGETCGQARGKRLGDATRGANARARLARTCETCGKPFQARNPSGKARAGRSREGRFCSTLCRDRRARPSTPDTPGGASEL